MAAGASESEAAGAAGVGGDGSADRGGDLGGVGGEELSGEGGCVAKFEESDCRAYASDAARDFELAEFFEREHPTAWGDA